MCYVLAHDGGRRTYVGKTVNVRRRLRQHNGDLAGGARSTRARTGRWRLVALVHGFASAADALRFEWRMHHPPRRRGRGIEARVAALGDVAALARWTRRAPPASATALRIELDAAAIDALTLATVRERVASLDHVSVVACDITLA